MNNAKNIIRLYMDYKKNHIDYDLEDVMNKALSIYYDKELDELYIHKKKSIVIAMFMKDIHNILKPVKKKFLFCCKKEKKIDIDKKISEYFYKNKIPIFINELLYIYRYKLSNHLRKDDILIFLKYEQNNNYINLINNMNFEQKIDLIKKIINEIIYI